MWILMECQPGHSFWVWQWVLYEGAVWRKSWELERDISNICSKQDLRKEETKRVGLPLLHVIRLGMFHCSCIIMKHAVTLRSGKSVDENTEISLHFIILGHFKKCSAVSCEFLHIILVRISCKRTLPTNTVNNKVLFLLVAHCLIH